MIQNASLEICKGIVLSRHELCHAFSMISPGSRSRYIMREKASWRSVPKNTTHNSTIWFLVALPPVLLVAQSCKAWPSEDQSTLPCDDPWVGYSHSRTFTDSKRMACGPPSCIRDYISSWSLENSSPKEVCCLLGRQGLGPGHWPLPLYLF